jgi:integrase/recombinase XerC
MVISGRRPATFNRRLDALRRLCRWAQASGSLVTGAARDVRTVRNQQPVGLTDVEVDAWLRAAGASSHGLAARNCAMVQLMLQAGLRVSEVASLQVADITMNDPVGI